MAPRGVLALCALQLSRQAGAEIGTGLCMDGQCINCIYCAGDCYSRCTCYNDINVCCCSSPPGYFARGYDKIACPGGTYQDDPGSVSCKACDEREDVLYNIHYRGATDKLECMEALCSTVCAPGNTTCEESQCHSAPLIVAKLSEAPVDQAFCDTLTPRIPSSACTWIQHSGASHRAAPVAAAVLAAAA
eukprot:CAMPEP_0176079418 /NCGR_PEP_ID=MMETSP0120_2-20121206/39722_1 /TAXON_ID=160619 /ORGANISM="Kryptoperidinium foliaceum, Strain CCMP 1326" /LENGTH=188 /DNA_ID=CAMNT_0017413177 /DNA_START=106 /DNA_END=668 /DNA_ORIENTATION=-